LICVAPFGLGPLVPELASFEIPAGHGDWSATRTSKPARDVRVGVANHGAIRPFVYRRYLDYGVSEACGDATLTEATPGLADQ